MSASEIGPLNEEPVSIRPPFDQRPPALPFDPDTERWRASILADRIAAISKARRGGAGRVRPKNDRVDGRVGRPDHRDVGIAAVPD